MAGYLNRTEHWALFVDAWAEELRAQPSIEYLKMAEAQNLRDQFDWRKGWTEEKRNGKLRSLARVIRHFDPLSFQMSMDREHFYRVLEQVSPRGLANPYFPCCSATIASLANFSSGSKLKSKIEFIFDEQDGVSSDIDMFFEHMKDTIPQNIQDWIEGRPLFRNDKQFTQLQAADMLAWHIRREHEVGGFPENPLPMADLLRNNSGHLISEIDNALIDKWADHHRQQPGVKFVRSKTQWRKVKKEIARLTALGIDPSKIKGPGVYYPRGTPLLARIIDRVRWLFRGTFSRR